MSKKKAVRLPPPPKTGWPPGMLQDDCRELSIWLANRIDSRRQAREALEILRAQAGSNRRKSDGV